MSIVLISADIGGTIVKIIFGSKNLVHRLPDYVISDRQLDRCYPDLMRSNFVVHFIKFPVKYLEEFIFYVKGFDLDFNNLKITGGGSEKYFSFFKGQKISYIKCDEISSLVQGVRFVTRYCRDSLFSFSWQDKVKKPHKEEISYPFLLVNIGSGVSIISVQKENYTRLTGTSLGGGTFWSLCRLLTDIDNFEQVEIYSNNGDNKNIDLLVGDIYGGDYEAIGLKSFNIASALGKVDLNKRGKYSFQCDLVKSLLYMISDNITQISYLSIKNLEHNYKAVIFTGTFTTIGPVLWKKLSYGVEFWSKSSMKALFLEHEGYLGAIGCNYN